MTRLLSLVAVSVCLVAAACGGSPSPGRGETVEIFVPLDSVESLAASLVDFTNASGIPVRVTGTDSFVSDLLEQVDVADPPDVALVPQPGVVAMLRRSNDIVALPEGVSAAMDVTLDPRLGFLTEVDGVAVAVPVRLSVKSLVWYRPEVVDDLGIEIPSRLDDLVALTEDLRGRGVTPWCFGLDAGGATGWIATDWTEDLLLRRSGSDVYERWIVGDVSFDSPQVADAYTAFEDLVLAPGSIEGGVAEALRTSVERSIDGLFSDPAECVFHRQASFASRQLPSGAEFGPDEDVDFFVLPAADGGDAPVVLGATVAVAFSDRPEVASVVRHLAGPEASQVWGDGGGFLSPHVSTSDEPAGAIDSALRRILETTSAVHIDASDSMHPELGSGVLWTEITRWVSGATSYDAFAETVDQARGRAELAAG
jgi:alpha-glucoside transport system substrate-binding protein